MSEPSKKKWNSLTPKQRAGMLGGKAGTGKSKARSSEKASEAAKASHAAKNARKSKL